MKRISFLSILFLMQVISGCSNSSTTKNYIDENKINATIVVSSLKTGKEYIINEKRAEQRFLPASTFKIPNTLIALQEGIIKDEKEIIKWDGIDKGFSEWNKDHNLKSAFPASCVWFYQELAKNIGIEKYSEYLNEINYGNKETGDRVDSFWLDGDIRISAKEQIDFLKKVYDEEFEFDEEYYKILKDIMIVENNDKYILRGKTGWTQHTKPGIGWFIGYIETSKDTWFFACNLDIYKDSDSDYRKDLVIKYLYELEIIE